MACFIITGATGGIGSAVVRRARHAGHEIIAIARNVEHLADLAAETGAVAYPCDVLDEAALKAMVEQIVTAHGAPDGLVHAVGSIFLKPLHATSLDDWRTALDINATSAFLALKTIVPSMMRAKRGSVVLFSTVAVQTGLQNHETIAAAKGAIEGLIHSAAISYSRYGIRVNGIAPALTRTGLSQSLWSNEAMLAASVAMHPLGRIGEPDDIASAALFALIDAAWMTGQVIGVDGGLSAGLQSARTKL
jgi:NAD(P)-dependent dehydrogenase (short-subunit alcohol dehydrogenase family)